MLIVSWQRSARGTLKEIPQGALGWRVGAGREGGGGGVLCCLTSPWANTVSLSSRRKPTSWHTTWNIYGISHYLFWMRQITPFLPSWCHTSLSSVEEKRIRLKSNVLCRCETKKSYLYTRMHTFFSFNVNCVKWWQLCGHVLNSSVFLFQNECIWLLT